MVTFVPPDVAAIDTVGETPSLPSLTLPSFLRAASLSSISFWSTSISFLLSVRLPCGAFSTSILNGTVEISSPLAEEITISASTTPPAASVCLVSSNVTVPSSLTTAGLRIAFPSGFSALNFAVIPLLIVTFSPLARIVALIYRLFASPCFA